MERIIIVSDQSERSKRLVSLLNELFPECDVGIVSGRLSAEEEHERRHVPTDESADSRARTRD